MQSIDSFYATDEFMTPSTRLRSTRPVRGEKVGWSGVTGATYIILGQCAKDGQVVDPYRALERVAQASLGDRHAGPNGGRLFRRVTSADTCHGQGKFLREWLADDI
uniref:Uncharacterized protein n=1 Tax=Anopheles coluzzii TaxID=1518534 RepID=A0A8W7PIN0_ANOCL